MNNNLISRAYEIAREQYAQLGVNTDEAIAAMDGVKISLHCWQTDDVGGFETPDAQLSGGGIQATGNYPGKAGSLDEVRADLDQVMTLLPGKQRLNLHAIYGDFGGKLVDRDQIGVEHFQSWIDWCRSHHIGMDFNSTCFSHPRAADGFTLSSKNESNRQFWVEHVKRCRAISAEIGKQLNSCCIHNIWVPDGSKDEPIDRNGYRTLLKKSLDEALAVAYPREHMRDAVESKLFGIGAESMTVGSHDFYLGYAISRGILICLDNGHFHPTEQVGDKISSCLQFLDEILLHVTRPVRWDSDHVVTLNDDIRMIASEIIRNGFLPRVHIGLDYFDASINRVGAYVTGTRAAQKAFLLALLEPYKKLLELEESGRLFERLALLEELKTKPFGAVWDYYCQCEGVPAGEEYITEVLRYEREANRF
ncbi:MAG: L-rhamnose isomerase [Bacteroidales bacterium]|nr:L-rhamnose isomerase [Bacteroidales bacterium]